MPWLPPTEYPTTSSEADTCQADGCRDLAMVRFTSIFDAVERRDKRIRTTVRCRLHAAELRAELAAKHAGTPLSVPVLPESKVAEPEIDSRRMRVVPPAPRKRVTFPIPADAAPTTCTSCGETIVFIRTRNDKLLPIEIFGEHAGEAHFAHCPHAGQHRRRA